MEPITGNRRETLERAEGTGPSWTTHPARQNPVRGAAVLGMIILVPIAVFMIFADPFLFALSFLLLALPLGSYFLPTRVQFDDSGVTMRSPLGMKSRRWGAFRSFQYDRVHLRLCTFSTPSRLDHYRGVLLRFGDNRDEVLSYVRDRIPSRSKGANE